MTGDPDGTRGARLVMTKSGRARTVGRVDAGTTDDLSVAFGLMSAAHPTAPFPAPDWSGSGHPWLPWALGGAVVVLLGGGMLALARRRGPLRI